MRKVLIALILACVVLTGACSRRNKVQNPLANLDSKQPDKVLFDRAMDALQRRQYDVSRLTFQTLINTYPDSEYIARAKLGVADSWYAEGNTAALAQAESEYKDFITFFPNMPEAAEAQLKVAGIHYRQMLKPDRDYTHAKRAEDEYRQLIQQFPDSKLVPEAKQRLREVQEVLAEREFRIGRFYYLRESYAASVARLKTLADQYPLYSNADQALWLLGQSYEHQLLGVKSFKASTKAAEQSKERLQGELQKRAADAYSRIILRYPVSPVADDAKARLQALSFPVPKPTPEAIAQNKAEIESRAEVGMMGKAWDNFRSRPNIASAAKVGEPSLEDQQPTNAPAVVRELGAAMMSDAGKSTATIEQVKPEDVKPNEATPRSDNGASDSSKANTADTNSGDANSANANSGKANSSTANSGSANSESGNSTEQAPDSAAEPTAARSSEQTGGDLSGQSAGDQSGISTLQVTKPADANAQTQPADKTVPAEPPAQVNDARTSDSSAKTGDTQQNNGSSDQQSSSKKKKKKKLGIF